MQVNGLVHPSDAPSVPVRSGKGSRDSLDIAWKYELLPEVMDFTYPQSLRCTNLLRMIWKHFRIATYDYDTSLRTIFQPGSGKDIGVKILMHRIEPKDVPGQPLSHRHPRQHPRGEWDRRNWYGLSYGQDMNAIAALTGPVARIIGPMGFKVEEVLVRVKPTAMLQEYGFKNHISATRAKNVPNDPTLLVFKATWLVDKTWTFVLAPTGPRFGWNWFALSWDNFREHNIDEVLRVRPLGTTRQVLDDQVVDNDRIPPHVMVVPDRIIRQRQQRDARLKLRELLNNYCEGHGYGTQTERLQGVKCYDTFGENIEAGMRKWASRWIQDVSRERHERIKAAAKIMFCKPWHIRRPFKFSVEPNFNLTQCQVAERSKAGRIDSAADPDASNVPAAPAAPPATGDTTAGSRKSLKHRISDTFDSNPFQKRRKRAHGYQPLDEEGPVGPHDRPLSNPTALPAPGQQDQQIPHSNQPVNFPGFDAYGVTGGVLDSATLADPHIADPDQATLPQQKDIEAWYLFQADEIESPDPRWVQMPPRHGQQVQEPHTLTPLNTAAARGATQNNPGARHLDEDEDAITPAPPTVPPKDDGAHGPTERMLWLHSQYINWDRYIRHWYFYEVDDEYRYLAEQGVVGPNSITIQKDLLIIPQLGFPEALRPKDKGANANEKA